jgi:hypothetical protein
MVESCFYPYLITCTLLINNHDQKQPSYIWTYRSNQKSKNDSAPISISTSPDFHRPIDRDCFIRREDCPAPAPRTQFPNHAALGSTGVWTHVSTPI